MNKNQLKDKIRELEVENKTLRSLVTQIIDRAYPAPIHIENQNQNQTEKENTI